MCLKSDSTELMRHMYQEAAKVVKYGGMTEKQAFETITLNGAKQLGLEKPRRQHRRGQGRRPGGVQRPPLNSYSRAGMTLVEGEVYFRGRTSLAVRLGGRAQAPSKPV